MALDQASKPIAPARDSDGSNYRVRPRSLVQALDSVFVGPAILLTLGVFLFPTVTALWHGFTTWAPGESGSFAGLANYRGLLTDDVFRRVLGNSLVYLIGVPVWVLVPLGVALLLYERLPGARLFRTFYMFPLVLSPAILGLLFQSILNPTNGLLNSGLRAAGLSGLERQWIDAPAWVKPSVILISLWGGLGMTVLIYHAALSAIPPELFEAAELDGASWWRKLRHVMIPGIRPVLEAVTALSVVSVFISLFGLIQVLTNGGPDNRSASLDFDIYNRSLVLQDFPGANAEAGVLLALVVGTVGLLLLVRRLLDRPRPVPTVHRRSLSDRVRRSRPVTAARGRAADVAAVWVRRVPRLSWSPLRMVLALLLLLVFVYPLVYLVGTAVKTQADFNTHPLGLPRSFTLEFVRTAWSDGHLGPALLNTALSVGVGVLLCTAVSSLASFWFLRHRGRIRAFAFTIIAIFYFVPGTVWVIPLNVMLAGLGLSDDRVVLGVVYGVSQLPFAIALLTTYLSRGLSEEILESASLDGASLFQQYRRIVLPLSAPALAAEVALVTAFLWGDLLVGLILIQDPAKYPVTLAATQLVGRVTPSLQESAAAGLVSFLPLLVLFAVSQRAMVRGITAGVGRV